MVINRFQIDMLLAKKQMTKSELAEKSGLSRQSISTILQRGSCKPVSASKIALGLGVSVDDIVVNPDTMAGA